MTNITQQLPAHDLEVGDLVRIRHGKWPIPALIDRVGMVVEVFRLPRESCMVRITGDGNQQREWFFYRDEVVIDDVAGVNGAALAPKP